MKKIFENLNRKLQRWVQGRYGMDALSKKMITVSFMCVLLSLLARLSVLYLLAVILLIWSYARCFSKNTYSRNKELVSYYNIRNKVTNDINLRKRMWKERKEYRYFKCEQCKSWNRVPKGKGKIKITCRVCKNIMRRKS